MKSSTTTPPKLTLAKPISLPWGSMGRTDLPGGNDAQMLASLRRLAQIEGDYTVYPGHMNATTLAREKTMNPYLRHALR